MQEHKKKYLLRCRFSVVNNNVLLSIIKLTISDTNKSLVILARCGKCREIE